MAQATDNSHIENLLEASTLTLTAQKVAVDKEITFRSTPALVALAAELATAILESPKQQTYLNLHDGVAVA